MNMIFEKSMRGGVSYVSEDIAKPTIRIWNIMKRNKNQHLLYT